MKPVNDSADISADFHPYREGYSVLPRLRQISREELFRHNASLHQRSLREKRLAALTQTVHVEYNLRDSLRSAVRTFLLNHYPVKLEPVATLEGIAEQMQEDVVIHALDDERDWMAFGHISFPSGWRPEENIGRTLREIHAPVPGIDLANSRKLVETMLHHGPFERFVWSVVFDDRLNFHPDQPCSSFNPANPVVLVKIERQTIVGFPEHHGALFLISQSLINAKEIDRPALANAIQQMNAEELKYKQLDQCKPDLLKWLGQRSI